LIIIIIIIISIYYFKYISSDSYNITCDTYALYDLIISYDVVNDVVSISLKNNMNKSIINLFNIFLLIIFIILFNIFLLYFL
jgi:hypothetical protein